MKRLAIAVLGAAVMTGCNSPKQNDVKSDYVFEIEATQWGGSALDIVKVTNATTGKSVKVMRYGSNGLIKLPDGF